MTKPKGAGFALPNGKTAYVKTGTRCPRKLKKKIKAGRKMNLPKLLREMFNLEAPKLPEQEVRIK